MGGAAEGPEGPSFGSGTAWEGPLWEAPPRGLRGRFRPLAHDRQAVQCVCPSPASGTCKRVEVRARRGLGAELRGG